MACDPMRMTRLVFALTSLLVTRPAWAICDLSTHATLSPGPYSHIPKAGVLYLIANIRDARLFKIVMLDSQGHSTDLTPDPLPSPRLTSVWRLRYHAPEGALHVSIHFLREPAADRNFEYVVDPAWRPANRGAPKVDAERIESDTQFGWLLTLRYDAPAFLLRWTPGDGAAVMSSGGGRAIDDTVLFLGQDVCDGQFPKWNGPKIRVSVAPLQVDGSQGPLSKPMTLNRPAALENPPDR